ncbi:MAG: hypothetical protein ABWW66_00990 [Archaeoglobaceae archaeon]
MVEVELALGFAGAVLGFLGGEYLARRAGLRVRRVRLKLEEIPAYLKSRYLARSCICVDGEVISEGVSREELEGMLKKLESVGARELITINGSEYRYVANFGNFVAYVRMSTLSLRDFAEVWSLIREVTP